jgi:catechol 2,3-dioxygenase-like lactoylglutathione lyase family enzyme
MAAKKAARKSAKSAPAKKKSPAKAKAKSAPRKSGTTTRSLALIDASPSFTVNDLEKSLAWYRDVLGMTLEESWKDDEGNVTGVSLKAGDVSFFIGQDDWKKGRDRTKGEGFRIFCMTKANVDDLAKKIEARGGTLDQGPTDQSWGVRDISLTDPDGFKITIAVAQR